MSFKCSVFGHRYGDPEVTREREEQGSEVVITIEETETCKRCGETRVVSENKEVTTLETPSDIVGDDIADEEGEATADDADAPAEPGESPTEPTPEETTTEDPTPPAEGDDAELIDEAEDDGPGMEGPSLGPDAAADDAPDEPATAAEEPEVEEADADEDDAVILDDDEDSEGDLDREPGEWPDEAEDEEEDDEWAPSTDTELRPVEEEQPDVEPTSNAVTVPEGTFRCPECDFTTDVESSSLRAGDFCPECHRGSLEHHADE